MRDPAFVRSSMIVSEEVDRLTLAIYADLYRAEVRRTGRERSPGAAVAHFCWALKQSQRLAEEASVSEEQ